MPNIYLYASEPNPNDIRLVDPTILVSGGTNATISAAVLAATFSIQVGTFTGDAKASPAVLASTFSVQAAAASETVDGTALPDVLTAAFSSLAVDASGTAPLQVTDRRLANRGGGEPYWYRQPKRLRSRKRDDEEAMLVGGAM